MEKSFEAKVGEATDLSLLITFKNPEITDDTVWAWADGLSQKRIYTIINGQCSLQASIDFDMEAEEKRVDDIIVKFKTMLKEINHEYN